MENTGNKPIIDLKTIHHSHLIMTVCYLTLLDVSNEHLLHSAERLWVSMAFSSNLISELKRAAAQSAT